MWIVGVLLAGAALQPQPSLPRTALPLALTGVAVDAAVPARSICLVRCPSSTQNQGTSIAGPGEHACDLAEIREIRDDAVVIRNLTTDRLELLPLQDKSEPAAPSPSANAASAPATGESADQLTVTLGRESVDHYLVNLSELLAAALATPHYASAGGPATMDGFELGSIKAGSIVEQLGFRNGDVILEVNGDKLDSLETVIGLLGQARSLTQAKVIVARGGRRMTFVFNTQ